MRFEVINEIDDIFFLIFAVLIKTHQLLKVVL